MHAPHTHPDPHPHIHTHTHTLTHPHTHKHVHSQPASQPAKHKRTQPTCCTNPFCTFNLRYPPPAFAQIPKRWYSHWITSDGVQANMDPEPTRVSNQDKANATLTFLVVMCAGFIIVLGMP